jgi:hypothetical protein
MKRHASQLSLILAAFAFAPAALAGSEIVKCVDSSGHATLTDQPCGGNATTLRLTPGAPEAPSGVLEQGEPEADADAGRVFEPGAEVGPAPVERHVATRGLLRQPDWKTPPAPGSKPLARDVATLKAARLQLLMMDSAAKRQPRLAGLH